MRQAEKKRKKNLVPNSVRTQPEQENSKKNRIKNQKIKKSLFGTSFSQNGKRQTEKERKKILVRNSVPTRPEQENFEKNRKKKSKN